MTARASTGLPVTAKMAVYRMNFPKARHLLERLDRFPADRAAGPPAAAIPGLRDTSEKPGLPIRTLRRIDTASRTGIAFFRSGGRRLAGCDPAARQERGEGAAGEPRSPDAEAPQVRNQREGPALRRVGRGRGGPGVVAPDAVGDL